MAILKVARLGHPVLRQPADPVPVAKIRTPEIQRLIDDMIETMQAAPGVGLAAPQIGVPLRLAVIEVEDKITVIVNPEIVKLSGEVELDEGCLSVPGFWGRLPRAERVSVKALDRNGKELRIRDAEGLFAQALQHEINHLDGQLYIDRMESLDKLQRSEPMRKREADARAARGLPPHPEEGEDEEPA
jgi:peptide deformylase